MATRLKHTCDTLKTMAPTLNENGIPSYDSLPLRKGDPHHSAWGLYGDDDQLGTLNRLTDERVAAAAKSEIQKGIRYVYHTRDSPVPVPISHLWNTVLMYVVS